MGSVCANVYLHVSCIFFFGSFITVISLFCLILVCFYFILFNNTFFLKKKKEQKVEFCVEGNWGGYRRGWERETIYIYIYIVIRKLDRHALSGWVMEGCII